MNLLDIFIIISTLLFFAANLLNSGFAKILELVVGVLVFFSLMNSTLIEDFFGSIASYHYFKVSICIIIAYIVKHLVGYMFNTLSIFSSVALSTGPLMIVDKTILVLYSIGHTMFLIFIFYCVAAIQHGYGNNPTWFTDSYFAQKTSAINKKAADKFGIIKFTQDPTSSAAVNKIIDGLKTGLNKTIDDTSQQFN